MSIEASQIECTLIALERATMVLRSRVSAIDAYGRMAALEQNIAASWMLAGQVCTTTFTGTIVDCAGAILSPSSIHIVGHDTGTDYGTFATSGGSFSVPLMLNLDETSVDVSAIGPTSARWAESTPTNYSFTRCQSNALGSLHPDPGTGYYCSPPCGWPVKKTLSLDDSVYGSYTILWDPGNPTLWRTSVPGPNTYVWNLISARVLNVNQGHVTNYPASLITASTCPDASTLLDITYAMPVDLQYPAGGTVRIYET